MARPPKKTPPPGKKQKAVAQPPLPPVPEGPLSNPDKFIWGAGDLVLLPKQGGGS